MFKFDLQSNEKLLNVYRQTELVLIRPVLVVFVLIYAPWVYLLKYELYEKFSTLVLFWTLAVLLYALNKYVLWLLNSYILTDKRLIHVKYNTVVHKQVIETPLERILNISYQTRGIMPSVFGFGDIDVQIVGLTEPMIIKNIKNPAKIKDYLWEIHSRHSAKHPAFDSKNLGEIQKTLGYQAK